MVLFPKETLKMTGKQLEEWNAKQEHPKSPGEVNHEIKMRNVAEAQTAEAKRELEERLASEEAAQQKQVVGEVEAAVDEPRGIAQVQVVEEAAHDEDDDRRQETQVMIQAGLEETKETMEGLEAMLASAMIVAEPDDNASAAMPESSVAREESFNGDKNDEEADNNNV